MHKQNDCLCEILFPVDLSFFTGKSYPKMYNGTGKVFIKKYWKKILVVTVLNNLLYLPQNNVNYTV